MLSPAALIRSILNPCMSASELGVILVSFEAELAKLAGVASLSELERRYAIVFLPLAERRARARLLGSIRDERM